MVTVRAQYLLTGSEVSSRATEPQKALGGIYTSPWAKVREICMGLALFQERRMANRRKLTGLLPGKLVLADTSRELMCRPIDVSEFGIGIVAAEQLEPGTKVVLILANCNVELSISWSKRDFSKQDMYRYGLVTASNEFNLEELFASAGCLR